MIFVTWHHTDKIDIVGRFGNDSRQQLHAVSIDVCSQAAYLSGMQNSDDEIFWVILE